MIRKLNFTGRKSIDRDRIEIFFVNEGPNKSFEANFDLTDLSLPPGAKIYIEPYHKSSFMRFDFGTVGNPKRPEHTILTDIPLTSLVNFRVKIVDESQQLGKIICSANKIRANNQEESGESKNRISIFHIDWEQDLGQEIYRVSFPENDFPRLEMNKKIEDARTLVKTNISFRMLVFPAVVREVAKQIITTLDDFELGDDSWQTTWLKFITNVLHISFDFEPEMSKEEAENWIETVVASFCRKNQCRSKFNLLNSNNREN